MDVLGVVVERGPTILGAWKTSESQKHRCRRSCRSVEIATSAICDASIDAKPILEKVDSVTMLVGIISIPTADGLLDQRVV